MMTKRPRPNHSPAFKAKVALAAISVAPNLLDQDFSCDGPDQKWGEREVKEF
ncbi:hypothetical protein ACLBWS_09645 [Brucellaceae bacterium D45D]